MTTVYKYQLQITDSQTVMMPKGAEVLSVAAQGDSLSLWAKVNPDAPMEKRKFYVHGTGHKIGAEVAIYRGTAMMYGGDLVLHVFEGALP